jgi:hypothetical protein
MEPLFIMIDPKDKVYKTILYDSPNGTRFIIRISEAEIERVKDRRFDRFPIYDMLEGKDSSLSYVVAYTIISQGIYLE